MKKEGGELQKSGRRRRKKKRRKGVIGGSPTWVIGLQT